MSDCNCAAYIVSCSDIGCPRTVLPADKRAILALTGENERLRAYAELQRGELQMRRSDRVNGDWQTLEGNNFTWQQVEVEVLMDIRAELRRLNGLLACPNFIGIPRTLRSIDRKLAKKRKPKAKA